MPSRVEDKETAGRALEAAGFYRSLGVGRLINAADTITEYGGPRLPDEVRTAMADAAGHQVDVGQLMRAAGARIAELTGNPAALVVNGAAAGLAVAVTASIAGRERPIAISLEQAQAARREVVVLCCQRNPYDAAIVAGGGVVRQVGYSDSTPIDEVREAISPTTAAVVWFAGTRFEQYSPSLETIAGIAHDAGLPVIVDAAAQLPPVSNLWTYHRRGADLVIFSGGKGLKGPQSSGLILGEVGWVAACARNSYPWHSVGRTMKTSKENIAGLLAAVERAVGLDWADHERRWAEDLAEVETRLVGLPVRTRTVPTGRLGQTCPRLEVSWDPSTGLLATELAGDLAGGDPSVRVATGELGELGVHINPYSLQPGEAAHVGRALADFVARRTRRTS